MCKLDIGPVVFLASAFQPVPPAHTSARLGYKPPPLAALTSPQSGARQDRLHNPCLLPALAAVASLEPTPPPAIPIKREETPDLEEFINQAISAPMEQQQQQPCCRDPRPGKRPRGQFSPTPAQASAPGQEQFRLKFTVKNPGSSSKQPLP
jgi:hypothetical protein